MPRRRLHHEGESLGHRRSGENMVLGDLPAQLLEAVSEVRCRAAGLENGRALFLSLTSWDGPYSWI